MAKIDSNCDQRQLALHGTLHELSCLNSCFGTTLMMPTRRQLGISACIGLICWTSVLCFCIHCLPVACAVIHSL